MMEGKRSEGSAFPIGERKAAYSLKQAERGWLAALYLAATVQFVWAYFWITRPYVQTLGYENGLERMPFQGRCLMMLLFRMTHRSSALYATSRMFAHLRYWFPRTVTPEIQVQGFVNLLSVLAAGWFTTRLYLSSSRKGPLVHFVYPLFLVSCGATYLLHTVQNFRYVYDLPSLAFIAAGMYAIRVRVRWAVFAVLFLIATVNRETTLLLLVLYAMDKLIREGSWHGWRARVWPMLGGTLPLLIVWCGWQVFVRHHFAANATEFHPRLRMNAKSLVSPQAWPQLLGACGYLVPLVVLWRGRIADRRLRMWLWLLPVWFAFQFTFGVLIETRISGEMIPLVVCAAACIFETMLLRAGEDAAFT